MTENAAAVRDVEREEHEQLLKDKEETPSIGGTAAAIITLESMGMTPPFRRSAFSEWLKLTKREREDGDTDRKEMGRLMEDVVATRFTRRTGVPLVKVPRLVHPQYPWYTGHMDRAAVPEPADVEIKTVGWYRDRDAEWSDPALEQVQRVPLSYLLQPVWYLGIPRPGPCPATESEHAPWHEHELGAFERRIYLAAQFDLDKPLRIYSWEPDETIRTIHARMFEECQKFWERYVVKDEPPPMPAQGEAARSWLKYRFPKNTSTDLVEGDAHAVEIALAYKEACAKEKEGKAEKEKLAAELGRLIGSAYGMRARDGMATALVSWPTIKAQVDTDWEAVVRDLKVDVPAELIVKHQKVVKESYRRMNVNVRGDPRNEEE